MTMTGNDHRRRDPGADIEERLLRRLRLISIVVVLACIMLATIGDTLGRLFIDPNFHSSEVIIGTLVGALVVLLGIQTVRRIPGVPTQKDDE